MILLVVVPPGSEREELEAQTAERQADFAGLAARALEEAKEEAEVEVDNRSAQSQRLSGLADDAWCRYRQRSN